MSTGEMNAAVRPSRLPLVLVGLVVLAASAAGGWYVFLRTPAADTPPGGTTTLPTGTPTAGPPTGTPPPTGEVPPPTGEVPPPPTGTVELPPPPTGTVVATGTGDAVPPPVGDAPPALAADGLKVVRSAELFTAGGKTFLKAGSQQKVKKGQVLPVVGPADAQGLWPLLGFARVRSVFAARSELELDLGAAAATGPRSLALAVAPGTLMPSGEGADFGEGKPPVTPVVDTPAPARRTLKARVRLQRTPVYAITLTNISGYTWTGCTVYLPNQQKGVLKSLATKFSREMPIQYFTSDPSAPRLTDQVEVRCKQGSVTLPATE